MEINSEDTLALSDKANAFDRLGKYGEAIKWYDKALEIDPKHVDALIAKKKHEKKFE